MSTDLLEPLTAAPKAVAKELLISGDSHVNEPHDLWEKNLPARFKASAPSFPQLRGSLDGGYDGKKRLAEAAQDGVSYEVLYPSRTAGLYALQDAELQEAAFRVYNDWIREYIGSNDERLIGIPSISVYNIKNAVKELERAHADGLRGGPQIWAAPPTDLPFSSSHYEPLWEAAEALGVPINLHVNSGPTHNRYGREGHNPTESFRNRVQLRTLDGADAIFDLIFYGVLHRHPNLKFVLAEHQIGWVPFYLEQWDWFATGQGQKAGKPRADLPFEGLPSEYYYKNIYSTFFSDQAGGQNLGWWKKAYDNTLWISDFPHANTSWPNSRQTIERDIGHLPADARAKILWQNTAKLYNIQNPTILKI
jgi:predicted TIM-barrel fold metal-dependent hydrolase